MYIGHCTKETFEFMSEEADQLAFRQASTVSAASAHKLAEAVRTLVQADMEIESIQVARDQEKEGTVVVRGRLLRPSAELFMPWLEELKPMGYTPILRSISGAPRDHVALHVVAGVAPKARPRVRINAILFVLTILSTLYSGSFYGEARAAVNPDSLFAPLLLLLTGWPFSATLLSILAAHEFGHYFAARYHRISVTLPYFIPMPLLLGTLGAFIQMKEPIPDRRKLFDVGVAGPIAGLLLALPLLFIGLASSPVMVSPNIDGALLEGNSILYYLAKISVFGKALPNPITGEDVFMNQVTFAAWAGLLVTGLNLMPIGQLDGGHTVFALFGKRARTINTVAIGLLAFSALSGIPALQARYPALVAFGFSGWTVWLILIFFMIGPFHPPALDDVTQLDGRRRFIGYLVIAIFILTFVPVPMRVL